MVDAGGARAAATSGLDSVGGGGPFWASCGPGEVEELGNLTVAAGLSIAVDFGVGIRVLSTACSADVADFGGGPCWFGGWLRYPWCI